MRPRVGFKMSRHQGKIAVMITFGVKAEGQRGLQGMKVNEYKKKGTFA